MMIMNEYIMKNKGAIGAYLTCGLLENKEKTNSQISIIARGSNLSAMKKQGGIRIKFSDSNTVKLVKCDPELITNNAKELGVQDYVIVCLKAYQSLESVSEIVPLLGPNTAVITAQNGIPWWFFYKHNNNHDNNKQSIYLKTVDGVEGSQYKIIGPERAIGCVVFPATELIEPGFVEHHYGKKFTLGEPSGEITDRIKKISGILIASGFEAPIRKDIRNDIFKKLWGNSCFNPLSVITEATLDIITSDPGTIAISKAIMKEVQLVGEKLGIQFNMDIDARIEGARGVGKHMTSMLQDYLKGNKLELDAISCSVQELAAIVNVKTVMLDAIVALVKQKEFVRQSNTKSKI